MSLYNSFIGTCKIFGDTEMIITSLNIYFYMIFTAVILIYMVMVYNKMMQYFSDFVKLT